MLVFPFLKIRKTLNFVLDQERQSSFGMWPGQESLSGCLPSHPEAMSPQARRIKLGPLRLTCVISNIQTDLSWGMNFQKGIFLEMASLSIIVTCSGQENV